MNLPQIVRDHMSAIGKLAAGKPKRISDEERKRRSERMLKVQRLGADLARVRREQREKGAQP